MTQEEKARAYEDALEKAKKELQACGSMECDAAKQLFRLFPELKESEDEKTRKRIIALVNAHGQGMYKDDMLAWLENIPYTIDHEKREGFHLGYKAGLEKQGEQKPDWSIKEKLMLNDIIETTERSNIFKENYQRELIDWLKSLKNRVLPQPKQEWSEEDEKMCQETIDWFEKKCFPYALENENPARESIKWLKSLKNRVIPQPKSAWSEEDQNALEDVREAVVHYWGGDTQDILLYWLKSLKQRIGG